MIWIAFNLKIQLGRIDILTVNIGDLLWLLSLEFYSFHCIAHICILWDLYLNIFLSLSLWSNVNGILFLTFNSSSGYSFVHCWYIGKLLTSCILQSWYNCLIVPGVTFTVLWDFLHRQSCHLRTKTVLFLLSKFCFFLLLFFS